VARETVKRALHLLPAERLIISRQGSGAFVRAQTQRPVELRPHIEAAFERPHVSIDFAGETLHDALTEALDKVRAGQLAPESITLRLLLSDLGAPTALPARADTGADDPAVRHRAQRITRRAVDGILDQVHELADLGVVPATTATARVHASSPQLELCLLAFLIGIRTPPRGQHRGHPLPNIDLVRTRRAGRDSFRSLVAWPTLGATTLAVEDADVFPPPGLPEISGVLRVIRHIDLEPVEPQRPRRLVIGCAPFSDIGIAVSFAVAVLVAARSIPRGTASAIFDGTAGISRTVGPDRPSSACMPPSIRRSG
jgi:hypothetical protein